MVDELRGIYGINGCGPWAFDKAFGAKSRVLQLRAVSVSPAVNLRLVAVQAIQVVEWIPADLLLGGKDSTKPGAENPGFSLRMKCQEWWSRCMVDRHGQQPWGFESPASPVLVASQVSGDGKVLLWDARDNDLSQPSRGTPWTPNPLAQGHLFCAKPGFMLQGSKKRILGGR